MAPRADVIDVVERAYALVPEEEWLQGVADAVRPHLDQGFGVVAFIYDAAPAAVKVLLATGSGTTREVVEAIDPIQRDASPDVIARTYRFLTGFAAASEITGLGDALCLGEQWMKHWGRLGVRDYLAFNAIVDPSGRGCSVGAPLRDVRATPRKVLGRWSRVAAHVSAGLRLRSELGHLESSDDAEAVLSPSGRVEHAVGEAKRAPLREALRDAAMRIDRARGRTRHQDSDEALALWWGLVSGRWSLVDRYERDGRRFLLALRNAPGVVEPRALSLRERQVAWYAALGHSNKLIAYHLGLALSTVAAHLSRTMQKLQVASRAELIALIRRLTSAPPCGDAPR